MARCSRHSLFLCQIRIDDMFEALLKICLCRAQMPLKSCPRKTVKPTSKAGSPHTLLHVSVRASTMTADPGAGCPMMPTEIFGANGTNMLSSFLSSNSLIRRVCRNNIMPAAMNRSHSRLGKSVIMVNAFITALRSRRNERRGFEGYLWDSSRSGR